jgi:hypothetical protein
MLISQQVQLDKCRRQGSRAASLAELRTALARPSRLSDGHRQRLLDLTQRLAAVQVLGDEYARVEASEFVRRAMGQGVAPQGGRPPSGARAPARI